MSYPSHVVEWRPRDSSRCYIAGERDPAKHVEIIKAGRSTGTTSGEIEFIYFHCKSEGSSEETEEYTVISESPQNIWGPYLQPIYIHG